MSLHINCKNQEITHSSSEDPVSDKSFALKEDEIRAKIEERKRIVEGQRAISANSAISLSEPTFEPSQSLGSSILKLEGWLDPLPIRSSPSPLSYPLNGLPPIIRDAVIQVQEVTQAPIGMVATSAISTLSAASQSLIDVERDYHLKGPVSLFSLILGDSGERKSSVDSLLTRGIKRFHEESKEAGIAQIRGHYAAHSAWQAKRDGITNQIKAFHKSKKSAATDTLEQLEKSLIDLNQKEPEHPLIPNILALDITTEKLLYQMAKEWPSCAIFSAEGGLIFGGRSFSKDNQLATLSIYNSIWSGESVRVSRKTSESFDLPGARLSLCISVQPHVFETFLASNLLSRDIGFLARCLFTYPESTQGQRPYKPTLSELKGLNAFDDLVFRLLKIPPHIEKRRLCPQKLELDQNAKLEWIKFHDSIEAQLAKGKRLEGLRDFGSKAAENAARVAAIIQVARGFPVAKINVESMIGGVQVVNWHLHEVIRYFGNESPGRKVLLAEAKKLDDWLRKFAQENGTLSISISEISQLGPNSIRKKEKLLGPLEYLAGLHRLRIAKESHKIELNPALFSQESTNASWD